MVTEMELEVPLPSPSTSSLRLRFDGLLQYVEETLDGLVLYSVFSHMCSHL